jgi:hypothetical protein
VKRAVVVVAFVLVLAGCGGTHTTNPSNTASRNVTKPLGRPLLVKLQGSGAHGTAQLRSSGSKTTAVSVQLAGAVHGKGLTAELAKGSCGQPKGLQTLKPLGSVSSRRQSWSVTESLTQLTASPLAVVVRSGRRVVSCGQVRQG